LARWTERLLGLCTIGIVLSLLFEASALLRAWCRLHEFLFGREWSPQMALRADQVGATGRFGILPLLVGTLLISLIAMCVAAPVGLLSAIYMSEYAHPQVRGVIKPVLEILAGIPTVVYGFFAALTVAPWLRNTGAEFGFFISSESALAAGLVMGVMIIPFVSSLSDDVISAVPRAMREGSSASARPSSETIKRVILPAALPGIVGALLLAVSRAIGETMIVVMAAGLVANLTVNPLEAVTTVTVQIVTLLVGDQEFDSPKTLAAFALGLVEDDPALLGQTRRVELQADDEVGMLLKGQIERDAPEAMRRLSDRQLAWIDRLRADGVLSLGFNETFFTSGDSREPELAGILGAAVGSFYAVLITLALCFPLGVATAVYLEEFAPRNRWTDLIEVNINNLAAVPSIVFGLLGLAVFIGFFGLPRSAPLVGGLVLSLMTLPIVIIAARVAIKTVPPTIREAAYGLGATPTQVIQHHVLPLAMPGILTGTIIGMARALGETAPLLMIGMVAFIVDVPSGPLDPATALPVQIFLWADSPERAFVEKTSGAILLLLAFLILMNGAAVWLRRRTERRW
jgi:phosphate transport system permease protein